MIFKIMRKLVILLAFIACAVSCTKKIASVEEKGLELVANISSSKTVLNSDMSLDWTTKDALTVFNAVAGSIEYSSRSKFNCVNAETGKFIEQSPVVAFEPDTQYDWYVACPYYNNVNAPTLIAGYTINRTPKQVGYGGTSHLTESDMMVGKALNTRTPSIALKRLGTMIKMTVTNNSSSAAAITGIEFDSKTTYITGSYQIDLTAENPSIDPTKMGSAKSTKSTLSIVNEEGNPITETIAVGSSADFYIIVAPFTVAPAGSIDITIKGSNGDCIVTKSFASGISFVADTYNTTSLSYAPVEIPENVLFMENFGEKVFATGIVKDYDKSGLYTKFEADKSSYAYAPYNNASIQIDTYLGQITSGAYVRFPKANASITISGINTHEHSSFTFSYTQDVEGTVTHAKWRKNGMSPADDWKTIASGVSGIGEKSMDFSVDDYSGLIDIQVQCTAGSFATPYPNIDNWKLVYND